ncbi:hypothetical protein BSKO_05037 [Bryopsis sp. KO-2023]|nr:hypothetical protein BSKO_05037 [Bryopsis sp. KO-2023]
MLAKMRSSPQAAVTGCAAFFLLLSMAQIAWGQNAFLEAAAVKLDADGNPINVFGGNDAERVGSTPPEVVIDKIVAVPITGGQDSIVLRNIGGQTAAISGWTLADSSGTEFVLQPSKQCPQFDTIAPADELKVAGNDEDSEFDPCGFNFNLGFRDFIKLSDAEGSLIQEMEWEGVDKGSALRRQHDGSYTMVPEDESVLNLLNSLGNYTFFLDALKIFAPNDEAFEALRLSLSGFGQQQLTRQQVLELPEMVDILKYHIIGGAYTSEFLLNNTEIVTSLGAELVPFNDPIMTEGKFNLHDSCVDKPTLDLYECDMQKEFGKCFEPFMVSPLAAQWKGGLCERTCGRCTCEFGQCAAIQMLDLEATNGVVHTVERVMFPPPIFKKEVLVFPPEVEQPDVNVGKTTQKKPTLTIGFKPRDTGADDEISILESDIPASG